MNVLQGIYVQLIKKIAIYQIAIWKDPHKRH